MALSFLKSDTTESVKDKSMQDTKDEKKKSTAKDTSKKTSSKKKTVSTSNNTDPKNKATKKNGSKLQGPLNKVYYSQGIKMFYKDSTWFYSLENILAISGTKYSKKFLDEFKDDEEYDDYFSDGIKKYTDKKNGDEKIDCINKDTVLRLVRKSNLTFPGSFVRWIETADKQPYAEPVTIKPKKDPEEETRPFNPSEGG